jgi:hypothetical protein
MFSEWFNWYRRWRKETRTPSRVWLGDRCLAFQMVQCIRKNTGLERNLGWALNPNSVAYGCEQGTLMFLSRDFLLHARRILPSTGHL